MADLKKVHAQFVDLNTDIYALSTDLPEQSLALKKDMKLPFELLSDTERNMLKTWDLLNPFEHGGVAVPAFIIINPDGNVCFMATGGTANRTQISELLLFLKKQRDDSSFTLDLKKGRRFVIPGPGALWQLTRNFVLRGNAADWRHFFLWPFGYIKKGGAYIKGKF